MTKTSEIRKTASLLLLAVIAFVCFHDGGFALYALASDGVLCDVEASGDCESGDSHEKDSCRCPAHLMETIDEPGRTLSRLEELSATHTTALCATLSSRFLSPSDPPPKV